MTYQKKKGISHEVIFAAITSELRGKWQENKRSSISKGDTNVVRWEQLKHILQSGRHKV
jgi:DNA primase small subunit